MTIAHLGFQSGFQSGFQLGFQSVIRSGLRSIRTGLQPWIWSVSRSVI